MVFVLVKRVKKFDGSIEDYDRRKIVLSIKRAGGTEELGNKMADIVEEKFKDIDEITTTMIRRVILVELERIDRDVKDSFLFYDRLVKGRITFETGKFLIVRVGSLYLGKNVVDLKPSGLSHLAEVEGLIAEFEEDMEVGGFRRDLADRRSRILLRAIEDSKLCGDDKMIAIQMVRNFRRKHGLS